jgi:hypothetical protein
MTEESESGSGSIPLTSASGSGSGRPKNSTANMIGALSYGLSKVTLIKKEMEFSSYIRKFRWEGGCKVIYEEGLHNI